MRAGLTSTAAKISMAHMQYMTTLDEVDLEVDLEHVNSHWICFTKVQKDYESVFREKAILKATSQ